MKKVVSQLALVFASLFSFQVSALENPFKNLDVIVSNLKFPPDLSSARSRVVRVAILDTGFQRYELEVGHTLPSATTFHMGPVVLPQTQTDSHGTVIVQLLSAILDRASNGDFALELHLYSAGAIKNLQAAVDDAISRNVEVVLYAQNLNPDAPMAEVISRASANGIIWINSAPTQIASAIAVASSESQSSSYNVSLPSNVELNDGRSFKGNSFAAAMFAAVATAYKSVYPNIKARDLLQKWNGDTTPPPRPSPPPPAPTPEPAATPLPDTPARSPGRGLPVYVLGFEPTGHGCFEKTVINFPPKSLVQLLNDGAIPVLTSKGVKVFVTVDPLEIIFGIRRVNITDMVVAANQGYYIYSRSSDGQLPDNYYEVVQVPENQYICN